MKRIYLSAILFPAILIAVGFYNFVLNSDSLITDIQENNISLKEVASGQVARNIEASYTENFISRGKLMQISSALNRLKGKSDKVEIVDTTGINVAQDWNDETQNETGEINHTSYGSILIIGNKAMELNRYDEKAIDSYAKTLNQVAEKLEHEAKVYSLIVPTPIEFIQDKKYKAMSYSQEDSIRETYSKYENVISVDAYSTLKEHSDEYIYFGTDHHWTQLGAYYAYAEFIKQFNVNPIELEEFNHFQIKDFIGSLYRMTQSEKLANNKDTIDVYEPRTPSKMYWSINKNNKGAKVIHKDYATEDNKYGVFLRGDTPLLYIESEANNDLSIAVIKDSYANAFIPFLTNHFSRIVVIDPRLWNGNLYDLVQEEAIDSVLFLNYALINRFEGYSDVLSKILIK
ncbi:MAG: DHHW family protein [Peptostreptococcales bacterium]